MCRANNAEFTQNTEITEENGVLRFNAVTGAEQGGYICTATNAVGTVTATATMNVIGGALTAWREAYYRSVTRAVIDVALGVA